MNVFFNIILVILLISLSIRSIFKTVLIIKGVFKNENKH